MDYGQVKAALEAMGYEVSVFPDAEAAAKYLDGEIDGTTVGMGGSVTLRDMGIYDMLERHNKVYWHWRAEGGDAQAALTAAKEAEVYLSSVNALSKNGEIVNIDGNGNRVASTIYGHKKVYFISGKNKLCEDLPSAIDRARNVAAPMNARRLGVKTPCAEKGERCYDCDSPARICRALSVLWKKPSACRYEVILIEQELGY